MVSSSNSRGNSFSQSTGIYMDFLMLCNLPVLRAAKNQAMNFLEEYECASVCVCVCAHGRGLGRSCEGERKTKRGQLEKDDTSDNIRGLTVVCPVWRGELREEIGRVTRLGRQ